VIVATLFIAAMFAPGSLKNLMDLGAPVVNGVVVSHTKLSGGWHESERFMIEVPAAAGSTPGPAAPALVRADTRGYVKLKAGDVVRFRYTGDPAREVFLFEHEENPHWVMLFCLGCAALFSFILWSRSRAARWVRAQFGWEAAEKGVRQTKADSGPQESEQPRDQGRLRVPDARVRP
jgi:hypothetical protein